MSIRSSLTALGKTPEAVEAACGAIVSWTQADEDRQLARDTLKGVLRQAEDLDAYVAQLDRQEAETGLDNPLARKTIGQVYLEQQKFPQAVSALQTAAQLQPNDAETHRLLIQCFDMQQDKQGAVAQMLRTLEVSRRDIQLYRDLGSRFESLGRPDDAERAYSSIVEVLPSEAASHALLAEVRQQQDRWPDAIGHWQQVAQIRSLEPTGLLRLAAAQIHQRQWDQAGESVSQLRAHVWPVRFTDVNAEIGRLQREIAAGRSK